MGFLDPAGHKAKTAHNRENSPQILQERGVSFESKSNGAHLIVWRGGVTVDFWPGTGLWIARTKGNRRGRGVFNLVRFLGGSQGGA